MRDGWSRREVLGLGTAALGSALLAGRASAAPGRRAFVWFSDTHVGAARGFDENLAMLRQIRRTLRPDFVVNGGDVTDYGWPEEHARYRRLREVFPFPMHHIPGNHDVRWSPLGLSIFRKELGPPFSRVDWQGVSLFLLDTTVPLSHWGSISHEQLRWLEKGLAGLGREAPVILGMHHWPGRGQAMIDRELDLARIIEPYNVKLILTGHGHSDLWWEWEGTACTMCRGLYQGSWQVQELVGSDLVVSRAVDGTGELKEVGRVPLAFDRSRRKATPVLIAFAAPGAAVPELASASEVSWKRDVWEKPSPAPAEPGVHPVAIRGARWRRGLVEVSGGPLKKVWQTELGGGVISQVRVLGDTFLVSTLGGAVLRLASSDGRVLWRTQLGGYCHSSPFAHEGLVWIGSADERLYALDASTGRVVHEVKTGGPVYSSASVAKGIAAVGSGDRHLYGVRIADGSVAWKTPLPASQSGFVQSPLATDGSRFFAGAWDNGLYCLEAESGSILWRGKCCEDMGFPYSPAIGGPAVFGGSVAVPANGNRLYCFDCVSGAEKWTAKSPGDKFGYSGPRVAGDRIVIGCLGDRGEVRCVSCSSGEILWTAEIGETAYDSTPWVWDGMAAIISTTGLLNVMSVADGRVLARRRLSPGLGVSSPAAAGGILCAATNSGLATGFRWVG